MVNRFVLSSLFLGCLLSFSVFAGQVFNVIDLAAEDVLSAVNVNSRAMIPQIVVGPDGQKELMLTARLEAADVMPGHTWQGWNIVIAGDIPAGRLTFSYQPLTRAELWINVVGTDVSGKSLTLDYPVNMYGASPVKVGVWNTLSFNLQKGHISGRTNNEWGALKTVSRIEFRLHPGVYKQVGCYQWRFRDFKIEVN